MLDGRGRARITDFGLAAPADAPENRDAQWGTPAYMAPEQLAGEPATARTDVYALGLVLFEIFTGRRPLGDGSKPESGSGSARVVPRPSSVVSGLDPSMDAAILRCLERDPTRRPASAVELLATLPGADPLERAVRAGETPSPELVAAAGEERSLSPGRAWGLFGVVLLVTAAAIVFGAGVSGLDQITMTQSPDVLRERAREIARLLGDDVPPRADAWWVRLDPGYVRFAQKDARAPSLGAARPAALRFYYRQSPRPILPIGSPVPSKRDPPPGSSGDAYIALDHQGRLLEFSRLARQLEPSAAGPTRATDWTTLLSLAGADATHLQPVQPLWTPDVACDARSAWVWNDGGVPVRLEAASWQGAAVWFRTVAPWERAERDAPVVGPAFTGFAFYLPLLVALTVTFALLARHNIRQGRSDMRGALRLAVAVFIGYSLQTTLLFRWAADPVHVWRWLNQWQPYFSALCAWLFYLGVEPFVRRRWPHRLIAWTRLLEGRWIDPLVGREVLIGLLAAAGAALASCIPAAVERHHDIQPLLLTLPLGRGADFWGSIAGSFGDGLTEAFGSFALVLFMRMLFRRDAAAWIGLGAAWTLSLLSSSSLSPIQWISTALMATCLVLGARAGVIAAIVSCISLDLLSACTPLTLDFSRWYAWRTGVITVLMIALAVWGFRAAMGRRRILSAAMFEG